MNRLYYVGSVLLSMALALNALRGNWPAATVAVLLMLWWQRETKR